MNSHTIRALFLDALYQVLDNRVFRVLGILVFLPVAAIFCIGFRKEELVILFGVKRYSYADLLDLPIIDAETVDGARLELIQNTANMIAGFLSGGLGMAIMIAATAFFVPRMLEKGAVETLFHKPVDRLWFYLSRYAAGLVFVALLCTLLVSGVFAGLLVSSGYAYPVVFWELPGAIYAFGIIHALSMAIGVWTRSTPAAMLLSLVFFIGNGCVHTTWQLKESFVRSEASQVAKEAAGEENEEFEGLARLLGGVGFALDTAHFVLPKPGDAEVMVASFRGQEAPSGSTVNLEVNGKKHGSITGEMGWDAEPRYNLLVSLASTAAFTLAVLFLGWRKLARADL